MVSPAVILQGTSFNDDAYFHCLPDQGLCLLVRRRRGAQWQPGDEVLRLHPDRAIGRRGKDQPDRSRSDFRSDLAEIGEIEPEQCKNALRRLGIGSLIGPQRIADAGRFGVEPDEPRPVLVVDTKIEPVERIDDPKLWPRDPPIRVRKSIPDCWLQLTIHEGRNRQVRRMTAAVGHPTLRLVPWSVGEWTLEGLAPGKWRKA